MCTARAFKRHSAIASVARSFERHVLEDAFFLPLDERAYLLDSLAEFVELCYDYVHKEPVD